MIIAPKISRRALALGAGGLAASMLAGCAGISRGAAASPVARVVEAELEFAALAQSIGWVEAFGRYAADDAFVFAPTMMSAHESLRQFAAAEPQPLTWWPTLAAVAASADFGFTCGPVLRPGETASAMQYFTVWRLQPDGAWKWIYDGGVGASDAAPDRARHPTLLATSHHSAPRAASLAEISAIESGFTTQAGIGEWLAADARVQRPGISVDRSDAERLPWPRTPIAFTALRAEASGAGDLVFSAGSASWSRGERRVDAHFARMWQRQTAGWRIVYDQIM